MHIYDVKNPQGLFCQSKADVKYKQHLVLLKTINSLPSFLLFVLLPYQWQLAPVGNTSNKRYLKGLNTSPLKRLKTKLSQTSCSLTVHEFSAGICLFIYLFIYLFISSFRLFLLINWFLCSSFSATYLLYLNIT